MLDIESVASLQSEHSGEDEQIDSSQISLRSLAVFHFVCKQRILCVDDDPMNLFAISHNLKMAMKLIRKECCALMETIIDTATYGQDAIDMF